MPNPNRDAGYSATLTADPDATGDFVAVRRSGEVVAEIAVVLSSPGEKARIVIKRFAAGELREVQTLDEFSG